MKYIDIFIPVKNNRNIERSLHCLNWSLFPHDFQWKSRLLKLKNIYKDLLNLCNSVCLFWFITWLKKYAGQYHPVNMTFDIARQYRSYIFPICSNNFHVLKRIKSSVFITTWLLTLGWKKAMPSPFGHYHFITLGWITMLILTLQVLFLLGWILNSLFSNDFEYKFPISFTKIKKHLTGHRLCCLPTSTDFPSIVTMDRSISSGKLKGVEGIAWVSKSFSWVSLTESNIMYYNIKLLICALFKSTS